MSQDHARPHDFVSLLFKYQQKEKKEKLQKRLLESFLRYTQTQKIKFKVGNHDRISKYKNIFLKGYEANWSAKNLMIKEADTKLWMVIQWY